MRRRRWVVLAAASLAPVALASCGGARPPSHAPAPAPAGSAASASSATPAASTARQAPRLAEDEGMWLYESFPTERLAAAHGFAPTKAWLDHARLSSARLGGGCSASFVSGDGLVMTNHHCAHRCIEEVSSPGKNLVESGHYAKRAQDELRCPGVEVAQLVAISDVSERVASATKGLAGKAWIAAQKAEIALIEKECGGGSDAKRCDVVSLWHGGRHHLYEYARHQDVRLVFAPELAIAFFGGDPDNFDFPRYDLDVAFLRVWKDGAPAKTPDHFTFSATGAKPGDLTFVSGHPGSTAREATVAELETTRDVLLPARIVRLSEARGLLEEFRKKGPEAVRVSSSTFFGIENGLKALKGRHAALLEPSFLDARRAAERELREHVARDPALAAEIGDPWAAVARAQATFRELRKPFSFVEGGAGFWSQLFGFARQLVRAADELPKPNGERLREWADAKLPSVKQGLFSTTPVHADLEIALLGLSLRQMREELGADDPLVRKVLGEKSPAELAALAVRGSKLADPKLRRALFEGGKAAVEASRDPMIALARLVDADARAIRARYEAEVEGVVKPASEKIAAARFALYGTSSYPDATGTLRLSYGVVRGFRRDGRDVAPITTFAGAFERHTGRDPFALPKSWLDARSRLDLDTPFDVSTTNDIIGGNSGSPLFDRDGAIVGLIFDGNLPSLGGDYAYDPRDNRAISVESPALLEALTKVYGAERVVREIVPASR